MDKKTESYQQRLSKVRADKDVKTALVALIGLHQAIRQSWISLEDVRDIGIASTIGGSRNREAQALARDVLQDLVRDASRLSSAIGVLEGSTRQRLASR